LIKFIKTTPQLDKTVLGDFFGEDLDFNKSCLYTYIDELNFDNMHFVDSLKKLLAGFRLPGEGQKVDRIMEKFGEKYCRDNPDKFETAECVYLLAYATIMC
jgi:Sec7-like guanine-nucleotide exchange factor